MKTYRFCLMGLFLIAMALAMAIMVSGCGNVELRDQAMTAAEVSTTQAFEAARRAEADEACPIWLKAYTVENAKQWRYFVRAAKKSETWGPLFENETTAVATAEVIADGLSELMAKGGE